MALERLAQALLQRRHPVLQELDVARIERAVGDEHEPYLERARKLVALSPIAHVLPSVERD
jgi:hypothetical protein